MMFRYQVEEKVLPATFLKLETDKSIAKFEKEQERKLTKREREQIKEDVLFQHLPNAFSDYKVTELYVDNIHEVVVINADFN